ncbi:unnamed protein product [Paramecium octaurelia]|uniref:Uncharacterized protein n=1 Tax=Paramecium octaurelia TaxID=43137 RepID=A0A8S1XXE8_PAROT|nr:unnamed protein product [Paramecium octaurelia]
MLIVNSKARTYYFFEELSQFSIIIYAQIMKPYFCQKEEFMRFIIYDDYEFQIHDSLINGGSSI